MSRPKLLDLFCGAGGAAMGYSRAGFDVVGVDIVEQPRYPFEFFSADALGILQNESWLDFHQFDAVHASPPCQGYSRMRRLPWLRGKEYPLLIDAVRDGCRLSGLPFVIENVEDAPLDPSFVLCGWTLGLPIYRHRRFESSHLFLAPPHRKHVQVIAPGRRNLNERRTASGGVMGVLPYGTTQGVERSFGTLIVVPDPCGHTAGSAAPHVKEAMGIDWMRCDELTQAIPPAYTFWIGERLMEIVRAN